MHRRASLRHCRLTIVFPRCGHSSSDPCTRHRAQTHGARRLVVGKSDSGQYPRSSCQTSLQPRRSFLAVPLAQRLTNVVPEARGSRDAPMMSSRQISRWPGLDILPMCALTPDECCLRSAIRPRDGSHAGPCKTVPAQPKRSSGWRACRPPRRSPPPPQGQSAGAHMSDAWFRRISSPLAIQHDRLATAQRRPRRCRVRCPAGRCPDRQFSRP